MQFYPIHNKILTITYIISLLAQPLAPSSKVCRFFKIVFVNINCLTSKMNIFLNVQEFFSQNSKLVYCSESYSFNYVEGSRVVPLQCLHPLRQYIIWPWRQHSWHPCVTNYADGTKKHFNCQTNLYDVHQRPVGKILPSI